MTMRVHLQLVAVDVRFDAVLAETVAEVAAAAAVVVASVAVVIVVAGLLSSVGASDVAPIEPSFVFSSLY